MPLLLHLARRLPLFLLVAGLLLASGQMEAAPRLNVLLIFADDQRADTIGAWGNSHIRTPNLDSLVRGGFSFRRNYCFGGNSGAVCIPSRAMLHSGRNWFHVDHQLQQATTLGELLRRSGYLTWATGKWHNGAPSWERSFERGRSVMIGGMSNHRKPPLRDPGPDGRLGPIREGRGHTSEIFADATVDFLKNYRDDRPFFAYAAFTAPHDPRDPPEKYRKEYYRRRPPLPANFMPQHPFNNGQLVLRDENLAPWPRPAAMISDQLAEYYGMVTHLDEQIGRILKTLRQRGLDRNTLVIYAADHGLAMGSHGLLGKQNIYEHSMRCPLIFSGPGVPAGGQSTGFTYLLDIYPTLCDALGIEPPAGLDGHSLKPVYTGAARQVRKSCFLPYLEHMRAVNDGRWKLIVYPKINHMQLFDLETDPNEMEDMAARPAQQPERDRLTALLRQWQQEAGDSLALTSENPGRKEIDLTGHERKPDQWQPDWIVQKYFGGKPD